jgi:hypothetical protein
LRKTTEFLLLPAFTTDADQRKGGQKESANVESRKRSYKSLNKSRRFSTPLPALGDGHVFCGAKGPPELCLDDTDG